MRSRGLNGSRCSVGYASTTRSSSPRTDRRPRRLLGRAHPARAARGGGVPGRAVSRPLARRRRRPGSPEPHAAGGRHSDPRRLLRGGSRHRDDEHVHRDDDRPGRLRLRGGRRPRDEPRGRAARAARRGRLDGAHAGEAAFRRRRGRPAQRLPLALAQGRGPGLPRGHVRAGSRCVRTSAHRARARAASTCS